MIVKWHGTPHKHRKSQSTRVFCLPGGGGLVVYIMTYVSGICILGLS